MKDVEFENPLTNDINDYDIIYLSTINDDHMQFARTRLRDLDGGMTFKIGRIFKSKICLCKLLEWFIRHDVALKFVKSDA